MSLNIQYLEGDGVNDDKYQLLIAIPDTNGGNLTVDGTIQLVGQSAMTIPQSSLAMPAAPGSGSIYWNIQVDGNSGIANIQQSTIGFPAPLTPTCRVVFNQQLTSANTDPAIDPAASTPDPSLGSP